MRRPFLKAMIKESRKSFEIKKSLRITASLICVKLPELQLIILFTVSLYNVTSGKSLKLIFFSSKWSWLVEKNTLKVIVFVSAGKEFVFCASVVSKVNVRRNVQMILIFMSVFSLMAYNVQSLASGGSLKGSRV